MANASPTWLFLLLAVSVALLGAGLSGWGLFWDRARGRRRCPRCWYDLSATYGRRCPECGHTAIEEGRLFRTRRRWRWAALGLVFLSGSTAAATPKIKRDGWLSVVPTTLLILASRPAGSDWKHPVSRELTRRDAAARLWGWQWKLVMERGQVVKAPQRWPAGRPLTVRLDLPAWAARRTWVALEYERGRPVEFHTPSFFCGNTSREERARYHYRVIGTPTRIGEPVRLDTVVEHIPTKKKIWHGVITLPVEIVSSIDEAFEPVRDPELTRLVREATTIRIVQWETNPPELPPLLRPSQRGGNQTAVVILVDRGRNAQLEEIALGFVVELLRDGEAVRTWRMPLRRSEPAAYERLRDPPTAQWMDPTELDRWSVRVCGLGGLAMADWRRDRYWAGEFTMPLAEVLDLSAPRPKFGLGSSVRFAFSFLLESTSGNCNSMDEP